MNVYYDPFSEVWICESDTYGKKYIGEGCTYNEAQRYGEQWQDDVLTAIEEKQHDYRLK